MMMMMMMKDAGLQVRHNLIWAKNCATFSMGRLDYDYQHEPIFYTWTERHNFYGHARSHWDSSLINLNIDIDSMTLAQAKNALRYIKEQTALNTTSLIKADKPLHNNLHPTMKPVQLIGHLMENSSLPGDIVADFFGGSGSTMIACEELGRKCRMIELDPHYCDVIVHRWEEYTGDKAKIERRSR